MIDRRVYSEREKTEERREKREGFVENRVRTFPGREAAGGARRENGEEMRKKTPEMPKLSDSRVC